MSGTRCGITYVDIPLGIIFTLCGGKPELCQLLRDSLVCHCYLVGWRPKKFGISRGLKKKASEK